MMLRWTLLILLAVAAGLDVKTRKIPTWLLLGGLAALLIEGLLQNAFSPGTTLAGVLVGAGLLLLSHLTRGKIGEADGVVFLWTGLVLGGLGNLWLLFLSLLLAGITGGVWQFFKKRRHLEIPWIPFILLAYLGVWFF